MVRRNAFSLFFVLCRLFVSVHAAGVIQRQAFSPRQVTAPSALDWDPKKTPFPTVYRDNDTSTFTSASKGNVVVPDPYHWFQDVNGSASQIQAFTDSQAAFTKKYLENVKELDTVRSSLEKADAYKVISLPHAFGPKNALVYLYYVLEANETKETYYLSNQADLDQAINVNFTFYPGTKLLDTNLVGVNESVFEVNVSPDGTKFFYSVSDDTGSNLTTYFRNVSSPLNADTKKDGDIGKYSDVIQNSVKTRWGPDSNSVFYVTQEEIDNANFSAISTLLYHGIGTDVKNDLVLASPENFPQGYHDFEISDDLGSLIIFFLSFTFDLVESSQVYVASLQQPLTSPLKWVTVANNETTDWFYLTNVGDAYYFETVQGYDKGKVIRCKLDFSQAKASPNIRDLQQKVVQQEEVIPERANSTVVAVITFDTDKLFIRYKKDDYPFAFIYDLTTGYELYEINFTHPDYPDYLYDVKASAYGTDLFFYFIGFNAPAVVMRASWNSTTNTLKSDPYYIVRTDFINPDDFITKQFWINSTDGVQVPIFLLYRQDLPLDGSAPVLLNAYGAYKRSADLGYSRRLYTFAHDFNGIGVSAGIRGGLDVGGEAWHEAGMLGNKHHTFEDILAVANALIDQKFTSPGKIILYGEGAGAMAEAAVINQAPQGLFGGLIGNDGFYDLLHADALNAKFRNPEFGDPQNSTAFDWLSAYSPVQNIDKSKTYPTIVLTVGGKYNSNEPWQTYEMIASLQYLLPSNPNPILLVNGTNQISTQIESISLAIVTHALGLKPN